MKLCILFLICSSIFAANYDLQQSYLLSAGVSDITVTDAAGGASTAVRCSPGAARTRVTFSENGVPPAGTPMRPTGSTTYSDLSGNPAAVTVFRNWGQVSYWCEAVDSGGGTLSPRIVRENLLPTLETVPAVGAFKMPLEVIGQKGFVVSATVNVPGSAGTGNVLYIEGHNLGYKNRTPVGGKCDVKVNGGSWVSITDANVTFIDDAPSFFGGIGSAPPVRKFTIPLANGLVVTGDNIVKFRSNFNGSDGVSSGCTIIDFNFQKAAIAVTGSFVVSSNVATVPITSTSTLTTGDWITVRNGPDIDATFSGNHQITVVDGTHISFSTCENQTGNISTGSCSTPNGTYTIPTTQYTTGTLGMVQPVSYIAKSLIPFSQFVQDDPSTWTAPSGGDASAGSTFWHTATLVIQGSPYTNFQTVAHCSDCHFQSGKELAISAFSNHRVEQRTIFHGGSWTDAKNVAAYIRSLGTATSAGRPYNPPFQPGVGLDSLSVEEFIGGAGKGSVLNYDLDSKRYLLPGGSTAALAYNAHVNWRELPMLTMLGTWDQWWPALWPGDYVFTASQWTGSAAAGCRDAALAGITSGDVTSYKNFSCPSTVNNGHFMIGYKDDLRAFSDPNSMSKATNFPGCPAGTGTCGARQAGWLRPSPYNLTLYSVFLVGQIGVLDVNYTLGFVDKLSDIYTAEYGASTSSYWTRGFYQTGTIFTGDLHFQALPVEGVQDATEITGKYLSNFFYQICGPLNPGNRRAFFTGPWDETYLSGFLNDMGNWTKRPNYYAMLISHLSAVQDTLDWPTIGGSVNVLINGLLPNQAWAVTEGSGFTTLADQRVVMEEIAKNITAILNKFSRSSWCTGQGIDCTQAITTAQMRDVWQNGNNDPNNLGAAIAVVLPALYDPAGYGINQTVASNLRDAISAIYLTHDFDADMHATQTFWVGKPGTGATRPTRPFYDNCPTCG